VPRGLFLETAGGEASPGLIDVAAKPKPPVRIVARVARIRKLLGADVDRDAMVEGLERLGLSVERSAGALDVVVPSWRPDLTIEDDIAEEVGRIALGYANLPETLPPVMTGGKDSPRGLFTTKAREICCGPGLQDALTHSLVAPSPLATPDEAAHRVTIRAALSPELSSLRTSLVPNLLGIVARAHASGLRDCALFEIGPVYRRDAEGVYEEPLRITAVFAGSAMPQAWSVKPDALVLDFYFAKGVVEDLLRGFGITNATFAPGTHSITHPGRTATVSAGGETLGIVAELSEVTVEAQDLPRRTYIFDLDGDAIARLAGDAKAHYTPLPKYPAVTRDLAPVFAASVPYADIEKAGDGRRRSPAGVAAPDGCLHGRDARRGPQIPDAPPDVPVRDGNAQRRGCRDRSANVRAALASLGGELRGA
jgi:phenylalanyl-tRNA synthetase beta chain